MRVVFGQVWGQQLSTWGVHAAAVSQRGGETVPYHRSESCHTLVAFDPGRMLQVGRQCAGRESVREVEDRRSGGSERAGVEDLNLAVAGVCSQGAGPGP